MGRLDSKLNRSFWAGCFAMLFAFVVLSRTTCVPAVDCKSNDPVCNPVLFIPQFLLKAQTSTRIVPTHLYALDTTGLRTLTVNQSTGELAGPVSGPMSVGTNPTGIAIGYDGKTLFSTSTSGSIGVHAFSLANPDAPVTAPGSPFMPASFPNLIAASATSPYVYTGDNGTNVIRGFAIDSSTGALTQVSGSPFGTGCIGSLAVDSRNRFLYGTAAGTLQVYSYTIDASTGGLTQTGNPAIVHGNALGTDPQGQRLFATNFASNANNIFVMNVDQSTGVASQLGTYSFTGGAVLASRVTVDPRGRFVYGLLASSDSIYGYKINNDGSLSALSGSPFGTANAPTAMAMSPDGNFLYANGDNSAAAQILYQYRVNSDGSLSQFATLTGSGASKGMVVRGTSVSE